MSARDVIARYDDNLADGYGHIDAILSALTAAGYRIVPPGGLDAEFGWLIEHGTSPTSAPAYYAGGASWAAEPYDPRRTSAWTSNHRHAIRFARKLDAERFAERAIAGIPVRVCEHAWDAAALRSLIEEPTNDAR